MAKEELEHQRKQQKRDDAAANATAKASKARASVDVAGNNRKCTNTRDSEMSAQTLHTARFVQLLRECRESKKLMNWTQKRKPSRANRGKAAHGGRNAATNLPQRI